MTSGAGLRHVPDRFRGFVSPRLLFPYDRPRRALIWTLTETMTSMTLDTGDLRGQ